MACTVSSFRSMFRRLSPASRWIFGGLLTASLFSSPLFSGTAHAQFNAQAILEPIVAEFGPKYQDVDTAIEHMKSGKMNDAIASLRTARQKNADLPPANMLMAQILFRLKQVPTAQAALEEAVREDANDPGAYIYLGELALQSRRWTEATVMFEKGLELCNKYSANPKRKNQLVVSAYSGLATMAELREDWPTAETLLKKLLDVEPANSLASTRLGRVMFKQASDREGETAVYKLFQELHSKDEKNTAHPDVNMALLYEQAGKRNNAQKMMEQAAKKDSKNPRTLLAVAKWAIDTGNLEMAQQNADAALSLDPESLDAKLYIGLVARFKNDLVTAEKMLKDAHLQAPTHLGAITQLALVLVEQNDEKKRGQAAAWAQLNTQLYSDLQEASGREAAITYSWILSRLGQNATAARNVQQVLQAGSISSDSAYHAAQILYDSGLTELAQKLLEPTLKSEAVFPTREAAKELLAKIQNR